MTDPTSPPTPKVVARLQTAPIAWFGSTRDDGQPHLVPVWFLWEGETILVFTKTGSQKVHNIRANPRATVALEGADDGEVVIVEGQAELLPEATAAVAGPVYWEKYGTQMEQMGMTPEGMAAEFAQPIRVRPTKFITW